MGKETPIVIIGFGNQAKAWALNLKDSGRHIKIALRENSPSIKEVLNLQLESILLGKELANFKNFIFLTPDHTHKDILEENHSYFPKNSKIVYAHGASLLEHQLQINYPQFVHLLLAPKAIASEVRFQFQTNGKLGACYSTEFCTESRIEENKDFLKSLASDLGITGGPYKATFSEEARADLFSEQSLLCGLLPYAAHHSFTMLRKKGVSKEVAYMECWLEIKLIADAMVKNGPSAFFQLISPNALLGAQKAQKLFFDKEYQRKLELLCDEVWNGKFFEQSSCIDYSNLKEEILNYWGTSELDQVHHKLAADLIPGSSDP